MPNKMHMHHIMFSFPPIKMWEDTRINIITYFQGSFTIFVKIFKFKTLRLHVYLLIKCYRTWQISINYFIISFDLLSHCFNEHWHFIKKGFGWLWQTTNYYFFLEDITWSRCTNNNNNNKDNVIIWRSKWKKL
jgi:hypothetical protein